MRFPIVVLCAVAWTGAVQAADEPAIGPPAEWIRPQPFDLDVAGPAGAPVTILLVDTQLRFTPAGEDIYTETAFRIETPEGLAASGSLGTTWYPDLQRVTVHKAHILRDGEVIDLLANGQTFTVLRRENNLEFAMLDGSLTAVLHPEGLRVGDALVFAKTLSSTEPLLAGFPQATVGNPGSHAARIRIRAQWDRDASIAWRGDGLFETAQESRKGAISEVALAIDGFEPQTPQAGAPHRYLVGPRLQFTSFDSWQRISSLLAPLYADAARLAADSPLHEELARIRAQTGDPREQAAAVLRLVQHQVRYLFRGINEGGLRPATADWTWARRYGDCKGKTVLLVALLRELGIEADPVAVNSVIGDAIPDTLPVIAAFNHVIVRARIGGRDYWLDGTRLGDRALDEIVAPVFYWGLPLTEPGSALVAIESVPPAKPLLRIVARFDYSNGVAAPAAVDATATLRGDSAITTRLALAGVGAAELDGVFRRFWAGYFPVAKPDRVAGRYDDATGEYVLTMGGTEVSQWSAGRYSSRSNSILLGAALALPEVDTGRQVPYKLAYPHFVELQEEIALPHAGSGFTIVGERQTVVAGVADFRRTVSIEGASRRFRARSATWSRRPKFRPIGNTASCISNGEFLTAREALERALELHPDPMSYLMRASIRARHSLLAANEDLDAALAIDPISRPPWSCASSCRSNAANSSKPFRSTPVPSGRRRTDAAGATPIARSLTWIRSDLCHNTRCPLAIAPRIAAQDTRIPPNTASTAGIGGTSSAIRFSSSAGVRRGRTAVFHRVLQPAPDSPGTPPSVPCRPETGACPH
jgi:hypothetical protein